MSYILIGLIAIIAVLSIVVIFMRLTLSHREATVNALIEKTNSLEAALKLSQKVAERAAELAAEYDSINSKINKVVKESKTNEELNNNLSDVFNNSLRTKDPIDTEYSPSLPKPDKTDYAKGINNDDIRRKRKHIFE